MEITNRITITELSRLTGKSRPTLYKYISSYENDIYDEVPYSFIQLFDAIKGGAGKKEIERICRLYFASDDQLTRIFNFINDHQKEMDLDALESYMKEQIK